MFPKSIQWRLVFIIITITFVLITVVWVFLNYNVGIIFYDKFKEPIETNLKELQINENTTIDELRDTLKNNAIINSLIVGTNRSYTIIDKDTIEIVYSSDPLYYKDEESKIRFKNMILKSENLIQVLSGQKVGENRNYIQDDNIAFYDYVTSKVLLDGEYILYFKYGREEALKTINSFNNVIFSGLFLAILASIIIGYFLSKTITIPIENIMIKAQNIASGDFGEVLEVKSNDELGNLTRTFNYMSTTLKEYVTEISREKNKIETIINYMTDGIIAFNLEGKIIHVNPAAKTLLDIERIEYTFNEFCIAYEIETDLNSIISEENNFSENNIIINEKYIKVQFALFTDKNKNAEGVIVMLQDITKQQKLENLRKEFVANVSHELKTPLTSIKSYTETLLDGAMEDKDTLESFLTVIDSETDRLSRLVKDLLQLSSYDSHKLKLNLEEVSIEEIVLDCTKRMLINSNEKNQIIETYIISNVQKIKGDRDRLEQLIINILSNSIKYTPETGKITIYMGTLYNEVYIKIVDTGIGIPEKDVERIFDRFYRVDKARSRQMGGTGLGLAISKEIVEAHRGTIEAKSELGRGTEITVKLPIT